MGILSLLRRSKRPDKDAHTLTLGLVNVFAPTTNIRRSDINTNLRWCSVELPVEGNATIYSTSNHARTSSVTQKDYICKEQQGTMYLKKRMENTTIKSCYGYKIKRFASSVTENTLKFSDVYKTANKKKRRKYRFDYMNSIAFVKPKQCYRFHTTATSSSDRPKDVNTRGNSSNAKDVTTTRIPVEAVLEDQNEQAGKNAKNPINWLLRITGYYGNESLNIRQSGAMYQSVLLHSSNNRALDFLGLEDSFYFNHSIIILHVWMLHRRLRSIENKDLQRDLQEQLFDRVWEDTTKRIRAIGVQELSVNKYVRDAQEFSFGAAWAYDQGLDADDEDALPGALFRNVFRSGEDVDDDKVILLSEYVYEQVENLDSINDNDVISGNISWLPMPGMDKNKNNDAENAKWREALSEDGRKYWWHIETRESTWRDPTVNKK
eukprot:g7685.t1